MNEPLEVPHSLWSPAALTASAAWLTSALFLTVGLLVQILHPAFGLWFGEVFLFLGVNHIQVERSGRDPLAYPKADRFRLRDAGAGWVFGMANYLIVVAIQTFSQAAFPESIRRAFDQSQLFDQQSRLELALLIAAVSTIAPFCEEYFFRGVLQQGLASMVRAPFAIGITAIAFSAMHLDPVGFAARLEMGILFGLLFHRTGSLWPGVFAHAANNIVSSAAFFAFGLDEAAAPRSPLWPAAATGIFGAASVLVLWRYALPAALPSSPRLPSAPRRAHAGRWIAAALASVLLLFLVDRRGVALNLYDAAVPLGRHDQASKVPIARIARLRRQARSGEIPLERYVEERRRIQQSAHPVR